MLGPITLQLFLNRYSSVQLSTKLPEYTELQQDQVIRELWLTLFVRNQKKG